MAAFQSNAARWSLTLGATSILLILWGVLVFSGDDASALPAIGSRRMLLGSSSWPGDASDASAIASETAVSRTLNTTNIRTYYISIDEVVWDYAPTDNDLCFDRPFTDVELPYVRASETTIGSSYTKAQFRAYTDATFSELSPVPPEWQHLGLLGPVLHAEEGDTIVTVVRNAAQFEFTFNLDGAVLSDNSTFIESEFPGQVVASRLVQPGGANATTPRGNVGGGPEAIRPNTTAVSVWKITSESAPGPGDESSIMWLYRSTLNGQQDNNAGLSGPLIVTRKGAANPDGTPADVDVEIVALFEVFDENASPYFDPATIPAGVNQSDDASMAAFYESNLKYAINGYTFCNNAPTMRMNKGDRVRWYLVALGNEVDVHAPHWHGNTGLVANNTQVMDQLNLLPINIQTFDMVPDAVGTWMFHCHVNEHLNAGMRTLYRVDGTDDQEAPGTVRQYFVQIEEVMWDFAPSGMNLCFDDTPGASISLDQGSEFTEDEALFTLPDPDARTIGSRARKARFIEYTDATFTRVLTRPETESLGVLGPILRAEVGDTIQILVRNVAQSNFSMHPHGVFYNKTSEGAAYADNSNLSTANHGFVAPGEAYTYRWFVPERAGPAANDPSSKVWLYHSHVDEIADTNAGLIGTIIVTRKGAAKSPADPAPADVDREFVALFSIMNELQSVYALNNTIELALGGNSTQEAVDELLSDDNYIESNLKHSINGRLYCNLRGLTMNVGERVRWHLVSLGSVLDVHVPSWGSHTLLSHSQRVDYTLMMSSSMTTLDMIPAEIPGAYNFQCHVDDHYLAGMKAMFQVNATAAGPLTAQGAPNGTVHVHYIAAEQVVWDYAPFEQDASCDGLQFGQEDLSDTWLNSTGPNQIGPVYIKAAYVEYTDDTFTTPLNIIPNEGGRSPGQRGEHLGLLGPLLRAQVGDTLQIVFRNKLTDLNVNMVPSGLSAGLPGAAVNRSVYFLSNSSAAAVGPNQTVIYQWPITAAMGPGPMDGSSVLWHYQSTVDTPTGIYAGLIGPIIITARGMARGVSLAGANDLIPPLMPTDIDREFVTVFGIWNENKSPFLSQNLVQYGNITEEDAEQVAADDADNDEESNLKHGINFRIFCNLPGLTANVGERVRFHTLGIGSEADLHTPNWGGGVSVLRQGGKRTMSFGLLSGIAQSADTLADTRGSWVYHCAVHDHQNAGMQAVYRVV